MKSQTLIYYLDPDASKCAAAYADIHVKDSIRIFADILSTVVQVKGFMGTRELNPFKQVKKANERRMNSPYYEWALANPANFFWLCDLAEALEQQMWLRFNRVHNSYGYCMNARTIATALLQDFWRGVKWEFTPPPIATINKIWRVMKHTDSQTNTEAETQTGYDILMTHRCYYINANNMYLTWTKTEPPLWLREAGNL